MEIKLYMLGRRKENMRKNNLWKRGIAVAVASVFASSVVVESFEPEQAAKPTAIKPASPTARIFFILVIIILSFNIIVYQNVNIILNH